MYFVNVYTQDQDEVLFVRSNPEQGTEWQLGSLSSFNYVSSVTNELSWLHLIRVGTKLALIDS